MPTQLRPLVVMGPWLAEVSKRFHSMILALLYLVGNLRNVGPEKQKGHLPIVVCRLQFLKSSELNYQAFLLLFSAVNVLFSR